MVNFIDSKEEMTELEARKLYKGLYIGFLTTKRVYDKRGTDNWLGRVLYTADTYKERAEIPAWTEDGKFITTLYGMGVKDLPTGGMTIVRKSE